MNDRRLDRSSNTVVPEENAELAILLDGLHTLLQRQLTLVRQGRLAAAVALFDETDRCVRHLAGARGRDGQDSSEQWQRIERLYQELSLVLTAQRTEVSAVLDATQRGRSVLKTYGNSLSSL